MNCQRCEGTGWLRRLVPGVAGGLVTNTRPCPECKATGKVSGEQVLRFGNDEPTIAKDFPGWARP